MRIGNWEWFNASGAAQEEDRKSDPFKHDPELIMTRCFDVDENLELVGKLLGEYLFSLMNGNDFSQSATPVFRSTVDHEHIAANPFPACLGLKKDLSPSLVGPCRNRSSIAGVTSDSTTSHFSETEEDSVWKSARGFGNLQVLFPSSFHSFRCLIFGDKAKDFAFSMSTILPTRPTGGKSKARFGVSADNRFIVKFVNHQEELFLRKYTDGLIWYWKRNLCDGLASMLVPILGAFVLPTRRSRSDNSAFVIMPNLMVRGFREIADLKGVGVRTRSGEKYEASECNGETVAKQGIQNRVCEPDSIILQRNNNIDNSHNSVLWDNDFRNWIDNSPVNLASVTYNYLQTALSNDTTFLQSLDVVDYSLLLVFREDASKKGNLNVSAGIIDFLRPFTWDKRIESVVKSVNATIVGMSSRLTSVSVPKEEDNAPLGAVEMPDAPTVIRPALYGLRFRTNILSLFALSES